MSKKTKLVYIDALLTNLNEYNIELLIGGVSKNFLFWSLHILSLVIYFFTVYINTIEIPEFTHSSFHKILMSSKLLVIIICLGILRALFNRFITWNNLKIREFLKGLFFIVCIGVFYHYMLVIAKNFITLKLYTEQSIPNIFVYQYQYIITNSVVDVLLWGVAFFALKVIINYNTNKLEYIDLKIKLEQEKINSIRQDMNPDFLIECLKMSEGMILKDVREARNQLSELSNILRHTLAIKNTASISWQEELSIVDSYLRLKIKAQKNTIDYSIQNFDHMAQVMLPHSSLYAIVKDIKLSNITYLSLASQVYEASFILLIKLKNKVNDTNNSNLSLINNLKEIETKYSGYVNIIFKEDHHAIRVNIENKFIAES